MTISLIDLGVVSGLLVVVVTLLRFILGRVYDKEIIDLHKQTDTNSTTIISMQLEAVKKDAELRSSTLSKNEIYSLIDDTHKRLDRVSDVMEGLQIAVAELSLLIKETRETLKSFRT